MKHKRLLLAAFALAAAGFFAPAWSSSYSTDQSDLWWIPSESGWGIQFVQRNSVIFATMFVYDASGVPTWYTATMSPDGLTWTGDLYATRGPWFGAVPFDRTTVQAIKVGTMTWSGSKVYTGTLTYAVNGVQVTKSVQREFIGLDDYSGDYVGNLHRVNTGCSNSAQNGTTDSLAAAEFRQIGDKMTFAFGDATNNVCAYTGRLSQLGQMGRITGTFNCANGDSGNFDFFELQVTVSGITGRFMINTTTSACTSTGWFGAGRGTTFTGNGSTGQSDATR